MCKAYLCKSSVCCELLPPCTLMTHAKLYITCHRPTSTHPTPAHLMAKSMWGMCCSIKWYLDNSALPTLGRGPFPVTTWQCPCAQSQVHEEMVCPLHPHNRIPTPTGWTGSPPVSQASLPNINAQPHWCCHGWMEGNLCSQVPKSDGKSSRESGGWYGSFWNEMLSAHFVHVSTYCWPCSVYLSLWQFTVKYPLGFSLQFDASC